MFYSYEWQLIIRAVTDFVERNPATTGQTGEELIPKLLKACEDSEND